MAASRIQLQWKGSVNSIGPCSCWLGNYSKVPLLLGVAALQKGSSQFSRKQESL